MTRTLRPYQQAAVDAVYAYLEANDTGNPAVVIPTGGGKTPLLSTLARDVVEVGGRVMILSHVKELLQQAADTLGQWAPELFGRVGLYSAGLKSRDKREPVLICSIQSVYKRALQFEPADLIIVDEAHLIPPSGDGMYQRFLGDASTNNPDVRVVGLTATPYRLGSGMIVGAGQILDEIVYEAGVRDLIDQGYLCQLVSKEGDETADLSGVAVRGGEYVEGEAADAMRAVLESACNEILALTQDRRGTLIFAPGVQYAKDVADYLASQGADVGAVFGDTPSDERDATIGRFKKMQLPYLVNVNVLTTGFDATHVDCIAMLRPTLSTGLYVQMAGRGLRLHPGKTDCLVLDYAGNVMRHGPIDAIDPKAQGSGGKGTGEAPVKACPECKELVLIAVMSCACGYEWPVEEKEPEPKHLSQALPTPILSSGATVERLEVQSVTYRVWDKRNDPEAPRTMRVDYMIGLRDHVSEWVCVEHDGFAGDKAERWWARRSTAPMPTTADEAVRVAREGALAIPAAIVVRREPKKFDRIVSYELGDPTEWDDEAAKLRAIGQRIVACVDDAEYELVLATIAEELGITEESRGDEALNARVFKYLQALESWLELGTPAQEAINEAINGEPELTEEIPF